MATKKGLASKLAKQAVNNTKNLKQQHNQASKKTRTQEKQTNKVSTTEGVRKIRAASNAAAQSAIRGKSKDKSVSAGSVQATAPVSLNAEHRLGVEQTKPQVNNSPDEFNKFLNSRGLKTIDTNNALLSKPFESKKHDNNLFQNKGVPTVESLLGGRQTTVESNIVRKNQVYNTAKTYNGLDSFNVNTVTPEIQEQFSKQQNAYNNMRSAIPLSVQVKNNIPMTNVEYWYIVDGNKMPSIEDCVKSSYKTVGRDRLNGIRDTDEFVIYDKLTGKIYRYDVDDETSAKLKNDMNEKYNQYDLTSAVVNQSLMHSSWRIEDAQLKLEQLKSTYEKTGMTDEYADNIKKAYDEYTKAINEYNDKLNVYKPYLDNLSDEYTKAVDKYKDYGVFGVSNDYAEKTHDAYVQFKEDKKNTDEIKNAIANTDDPYDINSIKDIVVGAQHISAGFSDTASLAGPDCLTSQNTNISTKKSVNAFAGYNTIKDLENAYINKKMAAWELHKQGLITTGDMLMIMTSNTLVDLSETLDALGPGEIKALAIDATPYLNAYIKAVKNNKDMFQYIDEEKARYKEKHNYSDKAIDRLKDYLGENGKSVQYDWNTDSFILNFLLETVSDPTVILGTAGKAIAKPASEKIAYKVTNEIFDLSAKQADDIAKFISKNMDSGLEKTVANALLRNGVEFTQHDLDRTVKSINDWLLHDCAYTIGKSFKDVGKAIDDMGSVVFTAETFGLNKALKPIAETGLNLVSKAAVKTGSTLSHATVKIVQDISETLSMLKNIISNVNNKTARPAEKAQEINKAIVDTVEKMDNKTISNILEIKPKFLKELTEENTKEVYNTWAREELADFLKLDKTNNKEVIQFFNNYGMHYDIKDDHEAVAKAVENYIRELNTSEIPKYLDKDNSAILSAINVEYMKTFTYKLKDMEHATELYKNAVNNVESIINDYKKVLTNSPDATDKKKLFDAYFTKVQGEVDSLILNLPKIENSAAKNNVFNLDTTTSLSKCKSIDDLTEFSNKLKSDAVMVSNYTNAITYYTGDFASKPEVLLGAGTDIEPKKIEETSKEIITNIFKNHGVTPTEDTLNEFSRINFAKLKGKGKVYNIDISDTFEMAKYFDRESLDEAVDIALNTDNKITRSLMATNEPILRKIDDYGNHKQLVQTLMTSDKIDDVLKTGLVDALGPSKKSRIDKIIRRYNVSNATEYEQCVDAVTRVICNNAERTITQRSDNIMWRSVIDGKVVSFNTANTEENVSKLVNALDEDKLPDIVKKSLGADENANNIFFSITSCEDNSIPACITIMGEDRKMKTYINGDVTFEVSDEYARRKWGADASVVMEQFEKLKAEHPEYVMSADEMIVAINQQLRDLRKLDTMKDGVRRTSRFVGYNNSYSVSNQSGDMVKMLTNNSFEAHAHEFVDVANYIRELKGCKYFNDEMYIEVRNAVNSVMHNVMLRDFQGLRTSIISDFTSKDADKFTALKARYIEAGLSPDDEMCTVLDDMVSGITEATDVITKRRTELGSCFIEEDALIDTLKACGANIKGEHMNLMKELYKNLTGDTALDYNISIAYDKKIVSEWIDEDALNISSFENVEKSHLVSISEANELVRDLNEFKSQIKNKALVESYPSEVYDKLLDELPDTRKFNVLVQHAKKSDDNLNKYTVLKYGYRKCNLEMREANQLFVEDILKKFKDASKGKKVSVIFKSFEDELKFVILNGDAELRKKYYASDFTTIRTMLKDDESALNKVYTTYDNVLEASKQFDKLDIRLSIQNKLLDKNNFKTADRVIYAMNFEPLRNNFKELEKDFENIINKRRQKAKNNMHKKYLGNAFKNLKEFYSVELAAEESKVLTDFVDSLKACNVFAVDAQIATITTIPKEQLTRFVMNDCYNALIFDTHSKSVIRHIPVISKLIEDCKEVGLTVRNSDGMIIVYKSKTDLDDVSFSKMITAQENIELTYKKAPIRTANPSSTNMLINNIRDGFSKYFNNTYELSTGIVATTDAYERIQELLPEDARVPVDLYNKHGKFDCNFMCNVITDADSELSRYVNAFGSADVISNLYSAATFAVNKMEYITDKFNVFLNPTTKLSNIVGNVDWITAKNALEENGMVVCKKVARKEKGVVIPYVQKLTIRSKKDFEKALKDDYCVLRNDVVLALNAQTKTMKAELVEPNNITKVLTNLQSDYISGWLFGTPGTWVRNIGDSNLKAVIQTHDVAYLKTRMEISEVLEEYHHAELSIYNKLQARYFDEGTIDDKLLDEIFAEGNYKKITKDDFKNIFASKSHEAGGVSDTLSAVANDEVKYLKDRLGFLNVDDKYIRDIVATRAKYGYDKLTPDQKFLLRNDYIEIFSKEYDKEIAEKAADVCMAYNPTEPTILKGALEKIVPLNKYMTFNSGQFEKAEEQTRTALMLYYTREKGMNVSGALDKVIESQFDYSRMPKWVNVIAPFQSYKIYNSLFWLETATKDMGILKPMMRWYKAADAYDEDNIAEYARLAYWTAYIQSGQYMEDYQHYEDMSYAEVVSESINSTINDYEGTNMYSSNNFGNVNIGDTHILKLGNSLYDAMDYVLSILTIPMSLNSAKEFVSNNIFSPLNEMYGLIKFMWDNKELYKTNPNEYANRFKKLLDDNATTLVDIMPLYGTMATNFLNMKRNYNTLDIGVSGVFPELKELLTHNSALDILTVLLPSVFAFQKDKYYDKPIGYDWYNQSDEYRETHRFVIGVSTGGLAEKNPFTYIDTYGRLLKLGYTKEEAKTMMKNGWHLSETNELEKYAINNELPNVLKYDSVTVNNTINYLLQRGFTPDEAYDYMLSGINWVDAMGVSHNGEAGLQLLQDSEWGTFIDMLPDYIKYDWENQYKPLYEHYKAEGFSHAQILTQLLFSNGYIDRNGNFKILTDEQVKLKSEQINEAFLEFYNELPQYCKYEDGAYSRTIKYIMNTMGFDTEQARQYMLNNNSYLDEDGIFHNYTDEEVKELNAKQQAEFEDYYSKLPDCIKYEKGAFSRTLKFLKEIGYTSEQAKAMIMNGYYIDEDGNVSNVKGKAYTRKNYKVTHSRYKRSRHRWIHYARRYRKYKRSWRKFRKRPRRSYNKKRRLKKVYFSKGHYNNYMKKPKKYKNQKIYKAGSYQTYSKQNVFLGTNRLQKATYKVNYSKINTKSAYPAAYRNVVYSNRGNMYKDLYAKYGNSRMVMRSGGYKAYSNASTTKLRRNAQKKHNMQNQAARLRVMRNS